MFFLCSFLLAACDPTDPRDTSVDSGTADSDSGRVDDSAADTAADTSVDTAPIDDTSVEEVHPNWVDDVAPILYAQCVDCHRQGGIGPFRLDSYEGAVDESNPSLLAMQARTMPPFLVDNSGECQSFSDARWLSDEDMATFEAWIDAGMPEGSGALPELAEPDHLEEVTSTLDVGGDYTPALSTGDKYRCFPVDWGFSGNTFLTAYSTEPGDASIVHHTTLYTLYDEA